MHAPASACKKASWHALEPRRRAMLCYNAVETQLLHGAGQILTDGWNEKALLKRLRAGEHAAFETLVLALGGRMRRVARSLVGSAAADDVVQDTWAAVLQALPSFEARASLKTWVLRILTNTAISRLRRSGREFAAGDLGDEEDLAALPTQRFDSRHHWRAPPHTWHAETPEALLASAQLRDVLERAVEALPPNQRAVLTLRDLAGEPMAEICNTLGVSATNARVLLHRARLRIWAAVETYQREHDA